MKTPGAVSIPHPRPNVWPGILLLSLLGVWRVLIGWLTAHGAAAALPAWLPGFTPIASLAFGGGFLLSSRLGGPVALGVMAVSDLALTAIYGESLGAGDLVARYGCLLALVLLGGAKRTRQAGASGLIVGTLAGAVLFYVVTNTVSWLGSTAYPHGLGGWVQALTVGVPGFPPTWIFFRNSLVSDLLVSMLITAISLSRADSAHREQSLEPRPAV